ncbi:MAG: anthranilate synthase component I family protein [Chitinophagaceae bacterium]|nr:anthranilate synthase component I family protein [Chitinophagaceae bacterium]
MLNWVNRFNIFCFLDSCDYSLPFHSQDCIAGAGSYKSISVNAGNALSSLENFHASSNDWCFGHLGYDLKNEIDGLSSNKTDKIGFDDLYFFIPDVVLQLKANELIIGVLDGNPENVYNELSLQPVYLPHISANISNIQSRMLRSEYVAAIKALQSHILRGDTYEVNFCQEFFTEAFIESPVSLFQSLLKVSPNPFAAYYRVKDSYLLCASPERFLKKEGNELISQPIKGTIKRDPDPAIDYQNSQALLNSAKEQAENVMVVDLVRNDLSRICKEGTVAVSELMGLYSFPQVHQMISTIKGTVNDDSSFTDIIKATFPMGSMTGAPKINTMKLIEKYETFRRGLFSGAVGYFAPSGDFDFNVVIRSLLYNATNGYLSFPTGSGITYYCNPEAEYEECLLKAMAIKKVLAS